VAGPRQVEGQEGGGEDPRLPRERQEGQANISVSFTDASGNSATETAKAKLIIKKKKK
jgi:hypothetical protein